jgi:hypothetical protein
MLHFFFFLLNIILIKFRNVFLFLKKHFKSIVIKELNDIQNRIPKPLDETEAYLRHRARVHEREKREKLKKKGKLDEYLAELEKNKPKPEPKPSSLMDLPGPEKLNFDEIIEKYREIQKFDKENFVQPCRYNFNICEKQQEEPFIKVQKKKKVRKSKKKKVVEDELEDDILLEDAEFKPQMAGRTGLPVFFFNNLVKANRSALQEAHARNQRSKTKFKQRH